MFKFTILNTKIIFNGIRRNFCDSTLFFNKKIIIENSSIAISPLDETHFIDIIPVLNSENLWKYNPRFFCKTTDDIKKYLIEAIESKNKKKRYPFIIFDKEKAKICGTTSFYNVSEKNKTISIGYTIIGNEFQRTGINFNSKRLILNWCFKNMDFERVDFHIDKDNEKSRKSVLRLGAVEDGILRSNLLLINGRRRDTVIYSILKTEWK